MSLQKGKVDPELGRKVHDYLFRKGVETPMRDNGMAPDQKIELIKNNFENIMSVLGLNLEDDSLCDTPRRVAKMFVNEIFWGLDYTNFPKCTVIENKMKYNEMVLEKDITMVTNCEHHFVVIDGKAHVAYIPKGKVLGLSKLNRIVEFFARRPQVQERIAEQVYHALEYILGTPDVAVVIEGVHYCVKMRGVEDHSSSTITSRLGGVFYDDPSVRSEFMSLIHSRSYNR